MNTRRLKPIPEGSPFAGTPCIELTQKVFQGRAFRVMVKHWEHSDADDRYDVYVLPLAAHRNRSFCSGRLVYIGPDDVQAWDKTARWLDVSA